MVKLKWQTTSTFGRGMKQPELTPLRIILKFLMLVISLLYVTAVSTVNLPEIKIYILTKRIVQKCSQTALYM